LTVAQGRRQVSFAIQADDDLTESGTVSVSATLIGADGVATHQTHLEANLQLQHETPVFDGVYNNPTGSEFLQSGALLPGRMRGQLLGNAFSEVIIGDHTSELIDASAGNNLVVERQHAGPGSDPYQAGDRIRTGNDADVVAGYLGAQVDVG